MPVTFHYSSDSGLLEIMADDFHKKYLNITTYRNLSNLDLELVFNQYSADEIQVSKNWIIFITNSQIDLAFKSLKDFSINEIEAFNDKNILLLCNASKVFVDKEVSNLFINNDFEIKKLNNATKRGFIAKRVKNLSYAKSSEIIKYVKDISPPDALFIVNFLRTLDDLNQLGVLNKTNVQSLIDSSTLNKTDYFGFLEKYLNRDDRDWISFMEENGSHLSSNSPDGFNKFLYSLGYKILEFRRILSLNGPFESSKDIAPILMLKPFSIKPFFDLIKDYGSCIGVWFDEFIFDFYRLQEKLVHNNNLNLNLVKLFLLKQKEQLRTYAK